jgi:type III pantothenate kinase
VSGVRDFLVVDAGNTRIKIARCEVDDPGSLPRLAEMDAVLCGERIDWDRIRNWPFHSPDVRGFVAGSNPPELARIVREWPQDWLPPAGIDDRRRLPIVINVDHPDRVGMDRIMNAIAANQLLQPGQAGIVVDSGTTVTVNAVAEGGFHGGAILPGFELSAKALHEYTALLPLMEHHRLYESMPTAIGRNTEAALESGLFWGHVGAVRELVQRMTDELRRQWTALPPLLVLTGGAARLLMPYLPGARYEPMLPLRGLAYVAGTISPKGERGASAP